MENYEQKVYDTLKKLDIPYIHYEHAPVYTMEEAQQLEIEMVGNHCKNLFIRNRKGNKHYLVILQESKKVDLKSLSKQIESTSLSFASEERLYKYLCLKPGSVTPFGLINDVDKDVEVLLDRDLSGSEKISFHPNVNTVTITLDYKDFEKYLHWCENKITHVEI